MYNRIDVVSLQEPDCMKINSLIAKNKKIQYCENHDLREYLFLIRAIFNMFFLHFHLFPVSYYSACT